MALAFFALNLFFYIDNWSHIYLLVFQPVRVPLYIGYFILGLYADLVRMGGHALDHACPAPQWWIGGASGRPSVSILQGHAKAL